MGNEWVSSLWEFEWLKNVDEFDVMSISEKSRIRYFLEVDIEYPGKLQELHNDYPLAPRKLLFQVICCQIIVKKLLISMR